MHIEDATLLYYLKCICVKSAKFKFATSSPKVDLKAKGKLIFQLAIVKQRDSILVQLCEVRLQAWFNSIDLNVWLATADSPNV
jgi:hypothetical protein